MKNLVLTVLIIQVSFSTINSQNKTSKFYTDSLFSNYLGEFRKHNIYLPKNFNIKENYKIIYGTDGSEIIKDSFIKFVLDSLIENKIIEPLIYVGSRSNSKAIKNNKIKTHDGLHIKIQYRNFEYVENMDIGNDFPELSERFKNHMLYFTEELILGIEKELKLSFLATDRIFYGVSNGAGFGANLLNKFPDVIGTYICYSTIGSNVENNLWKEDIKYPALYLQYGNEEGFIFKQEAEKLKMKYNKSNSFCELRSFIGGHDYKKWDEEFTKTIIKISNSEIE